MDGDEDLCADGRSRLAYRSRKTEKMTAKRRGKRLGAAEESGDLSRNVSEWRMVTAHKKGLLTPGPISPSPLKIPYRTMKSGRIFMMGKTAPPIMKPRIDHRTKPRVIVCRLPILSIKSPPRMQPGR